MPGASLMMRFFESPPRESRSASGPGTEADYQQGGGEDPGALRAAGRLRICRSPNGAATDKSIAWLADPSHRDEAIELLVKVARSSIEDAEPQRDCGPARNQSAWRHEAQAARRPGSQCRRHLLRTRVGASRAIRAQSG